MKNSIAKPYDYKGDFPIMMNLSQARRIVVKVGTSTLTYPTGKLNIRGIERLVRCIADLHNRGYEMVLVSSGCHRCRRCQNASAGAAQQHCP